MSNLLVAADLWDVSDGDHLWVAHSSTDHNLHHEVRVVDVDRVERNDGSARVEIEANILADSNPGGATIWTERESDVSDWSGVSVRTTFGTEGVVDTVIRFPTPDPVLAWDEHATQLRNATVLSEQESATRALKERGLSHREIGAILGIDKKTVDEYSIRITAKISRAQETVRRLAE